MEPTTTSSQNRSRLAELRATGSTVLAAVTAPPAYVACSPLMYPPGLGPRDDAVPSFANHSFWQSYKDDVPCNQRASRYHNGTALDSMEALRSQCAEMPPELEEVESVGSTADTAVAVACEADSLNVFADKPALSPIFLEPPGCAAELDVDLSFIDGIDSMEPMAVTGLCSAGVMPSIGSQLHFTGNCKPCAFFVKAGSVCVNGSECVFCHLCMPGEKKRRKKEVKTARMANRQHARLRQSAFY